MTSHKLRLFALAASVSLFAAAAIADELKISALEASNGKEDGVAVANALSPELAQTIVAAGEMKLENPSEINVAYGFASDGPMVPEAGAVQSKDKNVEATKTEPDKNTYLVLDGQKGPDGSYDYGTHFLFQGHENGVTKDDRAQGYLTRVNLDADEAHRVTLMGDTDNHGRPLPFIDGSAWNPFAKQLLLTGEEGDEGGVWQATAEFPSQIVDLRGVFGIGAYEGIQLDKDGTVWVIEDAGGKKGEVNKNARQPNSFVYRLVPADKTDLTKGGRLEVLQVMDASGQPIVFSDGKADDDISAPVQRELYSYGTHFKTRWVTVHDTAKDGMEPFEANKMAKAAGGTPMKRPENGQFRPGSGFTEFYFTATGDTDTKTQVGAEGGGFGGVFVLKQSAPSAAEGELRLVYRGDEMHSGFDNLAFWSVVHLMVVEDAGDKLHGQRKGFDAGYVIDVSADYSHDAVKPVRFLANGRDDWSTADAALVAKSDENGFQNDGDNEITGIHVSDGDASVEGLIGTKVPSVGSDGWRMFYTRQHGRNETYEVSLKK